MQTIIKLWKPSEEPSRQLIRYMITKIFVEQQKQGVKSIDSNIFHFIIYDVAQKVPGMNDLIPFGWYVHGPYSPWVDDVLVQDFGLELKYHQFKGEEPYCREFSETTYYEGEHE